MLHGHFWWLRRYKDLHYLSIINVWRFKNWIIFHLQRKRTIKYDGWTSPCAPWYLYSSNRGEISELMTLTNGQGGVFRDSASLHQLLLWEQWKLSATQDLARWPNIPARRILINQSEQNSVLSRCAMSRLCRKRCSCFHLPTAYTC